MIFGVVALLVFLAFICTIASSWQPQPKVPLWVGVLLLCLAVLIQVWPK
jgi:hypothetical protein